jgi:hypothetical protein
VVAEGLGQPGEVQRVEEKALQRPCAASGVAAKYSAMAVLAACRVRRKRSGISSPVS